MFPVVFFHQAPLSHCHVPTCTSEHVQLPSRPLQGSHGAEPLHLFSDLKHIPLFPVCCLLTICSLIAAMTFLMHTPVMALLLTIQLLPSMPTSVPETSWNAPVDLALAWCTASLSLLRQFGCGYWMHQVPLLGTPSNPDPRPYDSRTTQ